MNPLPPPAYMVGPVHRLRVVLPTVERTRSSTDEQGR